MVRDAVHIYHAYRQPGKKAKRLSLIHTQHTLSDSLDTFIDVLLRLSVLSQPGKLDTCVQPVGPRDHTLAIVIAAVLGVFMVGSLGIYMYRGRKRTGNYELIGDK